MRRSSRAGAAGLLGISLLTDLVAPGIAPAAETSVVKEVQDLLQISPEQRRRLVRGEVVSYSVTENSEGLATTGRLDARTLESLGIQVPPEPRLRADHVRELQRALADRGYDPGPVDGVMGTRTRAALRKYVAVPPPQAPAPADEIIKRFRANDRQQSP